jgi:hypothetical protein
VLFADGHQEPFDLIVLATGYDVRFPFLDESVLLAANGQPRLFLNVFSPERDDLFVIGLIQPNSGIWGLADWQSHLMAAYLQKKGTQPERVAWFDAQRQQGHDDLSGGIRYVNSPRHAIEVDYFTYRRRLQSLVTRMQRS